MKRVSLVYFHLSAAHAQLQENSGPSDPYIERFGDRIRHVHLSDGDVKTHQHLPLGSAFRSAVIWPQYIGLLRRSGYHGTITLRVFSPQREYLLLSRGLLKKWWAAAA
jgi:sugar phosphate isomerase/epimerase